MVRRQIPMDQDSFAYLIEVYMGEDMPLRALEFWNDMPKLIFPVMELIFPKFDASPDIHVFQDLHVYLEDGGHDRNMV
ncbi:hypothetical protein BASA60_003628 [Batrachochytrium salamandrivorans]|nr:hypothetical protein BASA60_003628 [Batrachochytrium salamandrivorans]